MKTDGCLFRKNRSQVFVKNLERISLKIINLKNSVFSLLLTALVDFSNNRL